MEILTGETVNISECMEFDFYGLCWYWDNQTDNIAGKIGIWIGASHRVGSALCYWVLNEKGNIGRWIGVLHRLGSALYYWVLTEK